MRSNRQVINRPHKEQFFTPLSAIRPILAAEYFQGKVFDPCAGDGKILDALGELGIPCDGFDIDPQAIHIRGPADFLMMSRQGDARINFCTNPPYGHNGNLAVKFIKHALELTEACDGKVVMLLPSDFDSGKTRVDLFDEHPAFVRKYTLTDRIYWTNLPPVDRSSSNHAWYVWDWCSVEDPAARPTQHWIHSSVKGGFR